MQLEAKKYLTDILQSITSIEEFLDNRRDFNVYESNKFLRRAVERELEIIGEAMGRLLKIFPEIEISKSKRIISLRNWVIHSYDNVDNVIIWGIITNDLPVLKSEVEKFLQS